MNTRAHGTSLIVGLYDRRPLFSDDCMYQGRSKDIHERLDRLSELIVGISDQRVERMAQASLTNEFERNASQPYYKVDIPWAVLQTRRNS